MLIILVVATLFLMGILNFPIPFISAPQGPSPSQGSSQLASNSFSGSGLNVSSINYSAGTVEFVIRNTGDSTIDINYGTVKHANSLSSNMLCSQMYVNPGSSVICRVNNVSAPNDTNLHVYLSYSFNGSESSLDAIGNVTAHKTNFLVAVSRTENYTNNSNATYLTTFVESGLPQGTPWHVVYDGIYGISSSNNIDFYTNQGNFTFIVSSVNSSTCMFYPNPVSGRALSGSTQFVDFSPSCATTTFVSPRQATFPGYRYSGIWWIDYGSHNASSMLGNNLIFSFNSTFSNASLQYNGGTVLYSNNTTLYCVFVGGNAKIGATVNASNSSLWTCNTYFIQSGLPPGYLWTVSMAGMNSSSNSNTIKFSEHPNWYAFKMYPVNVNGSVYYPSNASGSVLAGSVAYTYYAKSAALPQTTTFIESGLPVGITWTIHITGTPKCAMGPGPHCEIAGLLISNSSTNTNMTFSIVNSTIYHYTFYIPNVAYNNSTYTPTPSSGNASFGGTYAVRFYRSKPITTTIMESGLPSGTLWNASLLSPVCAISWIGTYHCMVALKIVTNSSTTNTITFNTQNATTYGFSVYNVSIGTKIYVPSSLHGLVNSSSSVSVVFTAHNVTNYTTTTIMESGLPSGTLWNASLLSPVCAISWIGKYHCLIAITTITNDSKTNTITFRTPVGSSYGFIVYNVTKGNLTYAPSPLRGLINSSSTVSVSFVPHNATMYTNTTFSGNGLPTGVSWTVTYDGLTKSANASSYVVFSTPAGTFAYSVTTPHNSSLGCTTDYNPSPASGNVAAGTYTVISFNKSTLCTTTFSESGLPSNLSWSVTYGSTTRSSQTSKITFASASSHYNFTVSSPTVSNCTYSPSPSSGVLSAGSSQSVTFSGSCITTFIQNGLPASHSWSVTYNGTTQNAGARCFGRCYYSSSISFTVSAGINYAYSVPTLTNSSNNCTSTYTPKPSSGYAAAGSYAYLTFSGSTSCTTSFIEFGLPTHANWHAIFDRLNESSNSTIMHFTTSGGSYSFLIQNVCYPPFNGTYYVPSVGNGTMQAGTTKYLNFTRGSPC